MLAKPGGARALEDVQLYSQFRTIEELYNLYLVVSNPPFMNDLDIEVL